jgi:bifunctional non-homologous end joining protein LigD
MAGVVQLAPAVFPGHPPMVKIAEPQGLLSAAQMNVVEFHTWNGVVRTIDRPIA